MGRLRFSKPICQHTIFHESCRFCLALQEEAYSKLAESGFEDIEDATNGRLLKQWAKSFYRTHPHIEVLSSGFPQGVFESDEFLLRHPEFKMVCESVCHHWNRKLSPEGILTLWSFHCEGKSGRAIALLLKTSEGSVRRILKQILEWKALL